MCVANANYEEQKVKKIAEKKQKKLKQAKVRKKILQHPTFDQL